MHQNCSCPSCVGVVRADYYATSPWYFNRGEAWQRDIPKRKPRRIALIRSVWQHVHGYEDWIYPIHRLWHDQRSIMHDFYALRRWGQKPLETTQVRLRFID